MKVLVTGGAGYIGAHVVRALAERGHEPIVLDDFRGSRRARASGFPLVELPLEDAAGVVATFQEHRPEGVIHLAGYVSVKGSVDDPGRYWENNLAAGASLTLAAARVPVKAFLFSSSAAVYGEVDVSPIPETAALSPSSPYGATKLAFERHLHAAAKACGFASIALRYFNAAGANPGWNVGEEHEPEEHLVPRVLSALLGGRPVPVYGGDYPTEDGTCVRDFVHVTDLAEAHVRALEAAESLAGKSLNVGTGRGYSVLEVAREAASVLGKSASIDIGPRRPGDPARLVADPSVLGAALGWKPSRGLREILETALAWERVRIGYTPRL